MEEENGKSESNFEIITVEQLQALYCDELLQVPYKLFRVNLLSGGRFYIEDHGNHQVDYFVGSTTFGKYLPMDEGLLRWFCAKGYFEAKEYTRQRAVYGTFYHKIIAEFTQTKRIESLRKLIADDFAL